MAPWLCCVVLVLLRHKSGHRHSSKNMGTLGVVVDPGSKLTLVRGKTKTPTDSISPHSAASVSVFTYVRDSNLCFAAQQAISCVLSLSNSSGQTTYFGQPSYLLPYSRLD